MKGNFAGRLGRKDGGATVDARGWIFWNEIDPRIQSVRVAATVAQNEGGPDERFGTGFARFDGCPVGVVRLGGAPSR